MSQQNLLKRFRKKVAKSGRLTAYRQKRWFVSKSELRRIAVEPFREEDLIPLAQLTDLEGDIEALDSELLATGTALEFLPEVPVTPQQSQRLRSGNPVLLIGRDAIISADEAIATVGRELIAIGSVEKGSFLPKRVFTASAA